MRKESEKITVNQFLENENAVRYNFECQFNDNKAYSELDTFLRYLTYKALSVVRCDYKEAAEFISDSKLKYSFLKDADGSNSNNFLVHEIYESIWGWIKFDEYFVCPRNVDILMGPDTINSVQYIVNMIFANEIEAPVTLKKIIQKYQTNKEFPEKVKKKEWSLLLKYIEVYHTIGNFVLVPAMFNSWRGSNGVIKDNFGRSLKCLKEGWGYTKVNENEETKEITVNTFFFDKNEYTHYINYFFLWDYVDSNGNPKIIDESNSEEFLKFACNAIQHRGHFMVLMLLIRTILETQKKDNHGNVYFDMMRKVFWDNKDVLSYEEVLEKIGDYFKNDRDFIELLNKRLKMQKNEYEIPLPEVPNEQN